LDKKPCKWKSFSTNIYSEEQLASWLQELGEKYEFYQLKLYEDKSARLIVRDWS
jgi:hypothetical protein